MNATIICAAQPGSAFRAAKAPSQTPLIPSIGARATQRLHQLAAFSLYSGEPQPQGPFSFLNLEASAEEKKADKPRSRAAPLNFALPKGKEQEQEAADFRKTTPGQPRFRSALEQVSYLTNESAINRK